MTRGVFARRLALGHARLLLDTQLRRERLDLILASWSLVVALSAASSAAVSCPEISISVVRLGLGRCIIGGSTLEVLLASFDSCLSVLEGDHMLLTYECRMIIFFLKVTGPSHSRGCHVTHSKLLSFTRVYTPCIA